ncbi:MAG: HEAT repeat domain-containing protein, partial [Victivallales bacterium]|nr:HEAT repeat domain-containing protein [Victivallales bacterium]
MILLISYIFISTLTYARSWEDPTWEEMIRDAEIIGLFEITEGGIDSAVLTPTKILKGDLGTNITVQGFNNNCASENWQLHRAQKNGEKAYFFLHRWRAEYRVPTPSTGIFRLNPNNTVNYFTFGPTHFANLPAHPAMEFEEFITNAVWFQESGTPNEESTQQLLSTIQQEIVEANTNSLPDHLVYYRLWGGRDWIEEFDSVTNNPAPSVRYHAAELLGEMLPSPNAEALLLNLLDDPLSMVQGQAVSALMKSSRTNETLAMLTKKLGSSAPGMIGPSSIMDPIMNTYLGGQLAIIKEIRTHGYVAATNELVAVAKTTRNSVVFRDAFRALQTFGSPELSGLIAIQLKSDDPFVVDDAIRLSKDLPKPVDVNVREALEHILLTTDLDSHETSIIFKSLTSESLPALIPKTELILKQKSPKWWAEDY